VVALQARLGAQDKAKELPVVSPQVASAPACIDCPPPQFPPEARKAKIESATVLLEIAISEKGRASEIKVLSDPGNGFAREALDAVKHWKFRPAVAPDGKKITSRVRLEVVSHQL